MLQVENLHLRAGDFRLQDISLHVEQGEYFVLMGQTGSGKSLMVKCICGLIRVDAGRIVIDERDVTDLAPRRRGVGYVPQEGALFPNMNVARNITFGQRVRGVPHRAALREVGPLIEMLGLGALLARHTDTLSGGERQKVALARALATRPHLLVLDEPVSALDEQTRKEVCEGLLRVHRELDLVTVHICHSTAEAHALADRIGTMRAGRLAS